MRELTQVQFNKTALPALRNIFKSDNPYIEPFGLNVEARLVIHEYWYTMRPLMFKAVITAAKQHNETGFYVSILNSYIDEEAGQPARWFLSLEEAPEYFQLDKLFIPPAHNVVFSEAGRWGIMGSDEHFGLLGGTADFVNIIRKYIPKIDNQVNGFLKEWKRNKTHYNSDISWLPGLLSNVYNSETAEKLLLRYHLK